MAKSINYKHLYYFWSVAREGSIAAASEQLHITPQTISGQITQLEDTIDTRLFERKGRGLQLTDKGQTVLKYADEIFSLGEELRDVLRGQPTTGPLEVIIGILDSIPKTIAGKIIEPALRMNQEVSIVCIEGSFEFILSNLAVHKIDLVLADQPLTSSYNIRAFNHPLGESGITFFGAPKLIKTYGKSFPENLNNAPVLLPTFNSTVRRSIDQWFQSMEIYPRIVGQFDDSALLKTFAEEGMGFFFMPTIIENDILQRFHVKSVGRVDEVKESFYAISAERKITHPAVSVIVNEWRA